MLNGYLFTGWTWQGCQNMEYTPDKSKTGPWCVERTAHSHVLYATAICSRGQTPMCTTWGSCCLQGGVHPKRVVPLWWDSASSYGCIQCHRTVFTIKKWNARKSINASQWSLCFCVAMLRLFDMTSQEAASVWCYRPTVSFQIRVQIVCT